MPTPSFGTAGSGGRPTGSHETMGIENIIEGDGVGLAITGMVIVYFGLVLVSLYIAALPRLFEQAERFGARRRQAVSAVPPAAPLPGGDPVLVAAIGYVLQMEAEYENALDSQRITMHHDESQRVWTAIGKMRTLSTRM